MSSTIVHEAAETPPGNPQAAASNDEEKNPFLVALGERVRALWLTDADGRTLAGAGGDDT